MQERRAVVAFTPEDLAELCRSEIPEVRQGAYVNLKGQTLERMAVDHCQVEITDLLRITGVQPLPDVENYAAARTGDVAAICQMDTSWINEKGNDGFTQLILAAANGHLEAVKALLKKGAKIDGRSKNGATPLMYATLMKRLDVVQLLLERGAAVDGKSEHGSTPLCFAAHEGYIEVVQLLLRKGADPHVGTEGKTPLQISVEKGHLEIAELLRKAGAR